MSRNAHSKKMNDLTTRHIINEIAAAHPARKIRECYSIVKKSHRVTKLLARESVSGMCVFPILTMVIIQYGTEILF